MEIALWIDTPALGDTIAAIPTLRKISEAYGNKPITVFTTKPFLFENHPLVKQAFKSDADKSDYMIYRTFSPLVGKQYDQHDTKIEFRYSNMDFRQFHAVSLGFTLQKHEMEMDLYIEKERELPVKDYVIIHPTHTWASRTWEREKWQELIDRLNSRGIPVVAVGRDSKEVGFFNTDKPVMDIDIKLGVNLLNDPDNDPAELRWMMNHRARAVVTMDSGMLHVAGTTDVNIIQLGSSIDNKLRAPYRGPEVSQDYKYFYVNGGCDVFCSSNMKSNVQVHGSIQGVPPQVRCLEDRPTFECHPTVDQVYQSVLDLYDVKPKIKIVHLLLSDDATPERQEMSIQSVKQLANRGVEYVQVWNERWKDTPPIETFARPGEWDSIPVKPGHYGNFRAFADAGRDHWSEDLDAIIFVEGDALIVKPVQEMVDDINRAWEATQTLDIAYFSFGSRYHLENGSLQSHTLEQHGDIHLVNRVIGAQMVMIPNKFRNFTLDRFVHHVWDAADIFMNNIFMMKFNMGIFDEPRTLQVDGTSAIDGIHKEHHDTRARLEVVEKAPKAFVAHCNEAYAPIIEKMLSTVREFSDIPAFAYVINSDYKINVPGVTTIRLDANMRTDEDLFTSHNEGDNIWVERKATSVYDIITKKVDACLHALENYAEQIVYLDGDSVATHRVNDLFDYYEDLEYPKFTTSVDEFMIVDGKGSPFTDDGLDLSLTIENNVCNLFGVDINNRHYPDNYIQTCYFVAGQRSIPFFKEWKDMCYNPTVVNDHNTYTPFHEETLANVLLWKNNFRKKLPLVYVNAVGAERVKEVFYDVNFSGNDDIMRHEGWFATPGKLETITMFHGEKRPHEVDKMLEVIKEFRDNEEKTRVLFLAPHLSTGGMPEFLLARVKALVNEPTLDVHVVEYNLYASTYVVQRDQIQALLPEGNFHEIGHLGDYEPAQRGEELKKIITKVRPDIIHIEESPESFDGFNQMTPEVQSWLYSNSQPWKIVETCHNIWFNPKENKRYFPDAFATVSPEHTMNTFNNIPSVTKEILFPIVTQSRSKNLRRKYLGDLGFNHKAEQYHIVNIGLWTPGKNQGELLEWAEAFEASDPGKYQFHFVGNQASNFEHYWGPLMENVPQNVHVHGERNDVDKFYQIADLIAFNSTWECNPLTVRQTLGWDIPIMARNLPQYWDIYKGQIIEITNSLKLNLAALIEACNTTTYKTNNTDTMARFKQEHLDLYKDMLTTKTTRSVGPKRDWTLTWDNGPKVTSHVGRDLVVDFKLAGKSIYKTTLKGDGHWAKPAKEFYEDWEVWIDDAKYELSMAGQTVAVQFNSSSLGDTLSWIEGCVAFKEKHQIKKLLIQTHKNWLFDHGYYEDLGVEFIDATGGLPEGAIARWQVGVYMEDPGGTVWFENKNRRDWRKIYLGDICTDALGIGSVKKAPKLAYFGKVEQQKPYICIATQSTAQAKYWNNPTGWQELVDYYKAKGYDVYHLSKEGTELKGIKQASEDLTEAYRLLQGAECFFGISSGLSWFAWATDCPVVLISGFTPEECENVEDGKTLRIINKDVCNGCWAWEHFNRGDWNWCPTGKGNERHFECTKAISAQSVIDQVEAWEVLNAKELVNEA